MDKQRKIRVAVVFGGKGPEHAVSCMGGGNMLGSIDRAKYEVIPVGITREGSWVLAADDPARLAVTGGQLPSVEAVAEPGTKVVPWGAGHSLTTSAPGQIPDLLGEVDVVLPVLHGPFGEDGTIQGLLEMADVPYVGAGVLASAVSMDKEYMKIIFQAKGLPVGPHVVVRERDWSVEDAEGTTWSAGDPEGKRVVDAIAELGWPLFVKPARGGSSIGTSKASDTAQLHAAIAVARSYDPKVIVEAAVAGRELECGVLEFPDGTVQASTIGEIRVAGVRGREDSFYDFATKYLDDAAELDVPAKVDDEVSDAVRELAIRAFKAIDCQGLARVDFFLTDDGPMINEVNTMPGFTTISMYPRMWAASGVDYRTLVATMVETAIARGTGLR